MLIMRTGAVDGVVAQAMTVSTQMKGAEGVTLEGDTFPHGPPMVNGTLGRDPPDFWKTLSGYNQPSDNRLPHAAASSTLSAHRSLRL